MGSGSQNGFDDLRGGWAAVDRPTDQALWGPGRILPVRFRHVRGDGAVTPLEGRALVAGDPFALVEDFHHLGAEAYLKLLLDQRVGHRVVVPGDLDVVVDVHTDLSPLGIIIGLGWEWAEGRAVERLKQTLAGAGQFFEGPALEPGEKRANGGVHLGESEEGGVP